MPDPKKNIKTKDTLYTWNGKQVNKQFSDSISFQRKYAEKMYKEGKKDFDFDKIKKSMRLMPGPGTLKKKFQGGEQKTTYNMSPYKMQPKGMGNNSYGMMPSNSKPKDKMKKIPGSDNPKNYVRGGAGGLGFLGSGGLKAAGKMLKAFTSTPKQLLQAARYKPWKVGDKQYGHIDRLTGKVTNKFNKSVSVDPNLLKKYPTGPKLHKFHKDQSIKFAEQFNKFTKKK